MDGWSLEDKAIGDFPGLWRELIVRLFNAMMSENAHDAEVGSRLRSWVTRSVDEFKPPIEVGFKAGLCIAIAGMATLELTSR